MAARHYHGSITSLQKTSLLYDSWVFFYVSFMIGRLVFGLSVNAILQKRKTT
ncbi:hypothetical protein BCR42DRAFT_426067 [Absidia repens]|uniref:Uncharacterized protein n=1 Tax=Absidia repens TaxID=90262 RepID=A0A1X2I1E1_9FUNG|nr:hypothetical protein BCR42DRAFT_426067 [Absidia repens]